MPSQMKILEVRPTALIPQVLHQSPIPAQQPVLLPLPIYLMLVGGQSNSILTGLILITEQLL